MTSLNLWKQQLGAVPADVWDRVELEALVLADNGLTEVSERLGRLTRLRMLDLGHNALAALPDAIGDLAGLTDFLYLHDNRLTALPRSLGKLARLRYLNVSDNAFDAFPDVLCELTGLVELRASGNRFAALP